MAQVRLEGIRKVYQDGREHVAVHGIDLDIADGEFVVLVGPSGCGKSTTLRMIAGLESITRGTLRIGDRVMNDEAPKSRDVAMVFQNYALYPHMTVKQNLGFALKLRGMAREEIDRRVERAAVTLELTEVLERRPAQLSGGQRQRVALGRALVREPQVFLFDEPLSNLDAKLRVQMRREIARLHRALGATMIYVTHDQVEAMTLGDRIVVMHAGHVQQVDTPLALYERPANRFVAGFIGTPAMNFLEGNVDADSEGGSLFRAAPGISIPLRLDERRTVPVGRPLTLGIRPEDLALATPPASENPTLLGRVELIEPMGNETFLHVNLGGPSFTVRVTSRVVSPPDSEVAIALDLRRAHFFDSETGERV